MENVLADTLQIYKDDVQQMKEWETSYVIMPGDKQYSVEQNEVQLDITKRCIMPYQVKRKLVKLSFEK